MTSEIRSYRSVFDLERRLYRIDRLRLNPAGVPLRGIVYFLALLGATLLAGALPLVGLLVRMLPWYLRDVGGPGVCAALLTLIKVEGRPFHLAAHALARYAMGPRELAGLRPRVSADRRWRPQELVVLADGSDSRLRRLRYTGPGAVLVCTAHVRSTWRPGLLRGLMCRPDMRLAALPAKPRPAKGQVIALADRARLEVRA
ncbi:MAG TPA: hypothetical protein VNU28_06550 [Solirubrobacteraceae bacterium]|jgi:hypothetical protein|nr:hypothetical protein [Solirubrobacteraceae bacterium]